jgi:hypothetical protein
MILAYAVAAGFWLLSSILAWHFGYKAGREDERFRTTSILIRESRRLVPEACKLLGNKANVCVAPSDAAHAAKELSNSQSAHPLQYRSSLPGHRGASHWCPGN